MMLYVYHCMPYLAQVSSQCCLVAKFLFLSKCSFSQAFQKELGKRAGCIRTLKRSVRDLTRSSTADAHWLQEQMDELEGRWEAVCKLSVSKQDRLEAALQQVVLTNNKGERYLVSLEKPHSTSWQASCLLI